jgi:hypothetical protein
MATIIAGAPATAMPLAGDADALHDGEEHDHDGGGGDTHVGHVEDRPVWQLEKVDHVTTKRTRRSNQPISEIACHTSTQQTDSDSPRGMADPRHEFDDHKSQHNDPGDGEDIGKALTLTKGGTGVPNEPQREQPAKQPDRGQRLELGYGDDLGGDIGREPGNGYQSDDKP